MWGHLSEIKLGWNWVISRTMIPNTAANLQQNVWKRKESRCCSCPGNVHTSTWLKCCDGTVRELCINKCLQTTMDGCYVVKTHIGQNSSTTMWETDNFKSLLLKVAQQAVVSWGVLIVILSISNDCMICCCISGFLCCIYNKCHFRTFSLHARNAVLDS